MGAQSSLVCVCVCALLVVAEVGVDTAQGAQGRMCLSESGEGGGPEAGDRWTPACAELVPCGQVLQNSRREEKLYLALIRDERPHFPHS